MTTIQNWTTSILQFEQSLWLVHLAIYLAVTIVALFIWSQFINILHKRTLQSNNPWSQALIKTLRRPIYLLIFFLGLQEMAETFLQGLELLAFSTQVESIGSFLIWVYILWILLRLITAVETTYRSHGSETLEKRKMDKATLTPIFYGLRAMVALIALLSVLDFLGVSVSGLLAAGGLGGILLGFAAKDSLSNFFAGALIFWERPFVVGDWIIQPEENIEGVVEHIGWRTTQIRTFDQRPLYVPNSKFFNSVIENPQRMTNRRIYEYMGLRYDDIDKLPAVLKDIRAYLLAHPDLDHDQIQMVNFDRYGEWSVDFFIYTMTKTIEWQAFHYVKEEVLLNIARIVKQHGCSFAFPTKTVHYNIDKNDASSTLPPSI